MCLGYIIDYRVIRPTEYAEALYNDSWEQVSL
jgi:hypothetical protein